MKRPLSPLFARVAPLLVALPFIVAMKPFSGVKTVCATCSPPAGWDVVVMKGGAKLPCQVIAKNADYYVLKRYGELRTAALDEVARVEWHGGSSSSSLSTQDQLRTTGGSVFSGKINGEDPGRWLSIEMGTRTYVVWLTELLDAHKQGARYTPEPPPREKGSE